MRPTFSALILIVATGLIGPSSRPTALANGQVESIGEPRSGDGASRPTSSSEKNLTSSRREPSPAASATSRPHAEAGTDTNPPDRPAPDGDSKVTVPGVASTAFGARVPLPPSIPRPQGAYPIDLSTALRLAEVQNPTIAIARTTIIEALAVQLAARTLLLPSLNAGSNYHLHTGNLQRSSGRILSLTEQSLYFGGGARTLAAESVGIPAVNIFSPLTDAWFEPLAAHQRVIRSRFFTQATINDILLDVVILHIDLLGSQSILEAQRLTERQGYDVVKITNSYAVAGEGRTADANRAQTDWRLRRGEVQKAEESVAVTAARLANRLNLDPTIRLEPIGGPLVPINLIALDTPGPDLVRYALGRRPELTMRTAEINEAEYRRREEVVRPFLPTIWLGFSGGVYGGGSNVIPPTLANFAGRSDFDIRLFWTFSNLGAGNVALIRNRAARLGQAEAERARTINRVREEVTAALARAKAASAEIILARNQLTTSEHGFQEDLERSRQNLGRPIEVLNSLNLLGDARVALIRALVHYDQAQFRLYVALGSPPPLTGPGDAPGGPPPLNTPLHGRMTMPGIARLFH